MVVLFEEERWETTSSLLILPSERDEVTSSSLILFSSAIFLADGEDLAGEDFVSTLTAFTSSFIFSSLFSVFLGLGVLPFDSSKIPKIPPISTSVPSETFISFREPAWGAGTSTVILSVSISTKGSSASKLSPIFLSHF